MAKIPSYPELPGASLALADKLAITDNSASEKQKHTTIEALDYRYALKSNIVASALGIKYFWIDNAARIAETGMVAGEFGYMSDTTANRLLGIVGDLYQYIVTTWTLVGRILLDGSVYSYDFQGSGNYLLNWQTSQDAQPFKSAHFNGSSSFGEFTQEAIDCAVGGGVDLTFKLNKSKNFNTLYGTGSGTLNQMYHSGTKFIGENSTDEKYIDQDFTFDLLYHTLSWSCDDSGAVTSYIDGVPFDTQTVTADIDIRYLARRSAAYGDVDISHFRIWNKARSVDELKIYSSNPNKSLGFDDEESNNTTLTSGTVEIGKNYKTILYVAGDDLENVASTGAAANVTGAEWTAIATTPTTWANSSEILRQGVVVDLKPEDMSPIKAKDVANENDAAFTDVEIVNKSLDHIYQDPYRTISDAQTFVVPKGCAFLEILINVKTLEAAQVIRIGTTPGGEEVVADSAAPQTLGMKRLTVLIDGFSAGDTLHIGDGAGTWSALVADLYVRYQILA